jgi:hypothetical protein
MSTKPKGVVCYSANELNHFYIKGDGANAEILIGYETTADDTELPMYIKSSSISIMRGVAKTNLQTALTTIETNHTTLDTAVSSIETNLNNEISKSK